LIATAVLYGLGAQPLAAGLYAAPLYLSRELHQSQASLGHLLWIPPLGWEIGYLAFGALADKQSMALARSPGVIFAALSAFSLSAAAIPFTHSLPLVMALLFFSMFLGGGFVVLSLSQGLADSTPTSQIQACRGPRQRNAKPGFLAGTCVAAWSIAVAVLMPLIGRMFDHHQYRQAFLLFALMPAIGTLLWQSLRPKEAPILRAD
jgi:MFS family permease